MVEPNMFVAVIWNHPTEAQPFSCLTSWMSMGFSGIKSCTGEDGPSADGQPLLDSLWRLNHWQKKTKKIVLNWRNPYNMPLGFRNWKTDMARQSLVFQCQLIPLAKKKGRCKPSKPCFNLQFFDNSGIIRHLQQLRDPILLYIHYNPILTTK